jgi:hypothetical protein
MHKPQCVICGQPATIQETAITGGKPTVRHLCQEHGESLLPAIDPDSQAASLRTLEEHYRSLSDAERENLALEYHLTRRARNRLGPDAAEET